MLVEHLTGTSLGVDIVREGIRPSATSPYPRRMSPNACVGFLFGALALILQLRSTKAALRRLSLLFLFGVGAIGAAGCVGYFLRLEVLYTLSSANRLTLPVAYGLVFLAAGLWLLFEQSSNRRSFERHEARITKRSVAVVALVTLAAGVAGFATVEKSFEEVQARTLVVRASSSLMPPSTRAVICVRIVASGLRASSRCDGSGGAAASPAAEPLSAAEPGGGCEPCDLRTSSSRRPMERRSSVTT